MRILPVQLKSLIAQFSNSLMVSKIRLFKNTPTIAYYWRTLSLLTFLLFILILVGVSVKYPGKIISPIIATFSPLEPLTEGKKGYEVFGFAPYWTINKLDGVDYSTLTTLAYFGMEIDGNGDIIQDDPGYATFHSKRATEIFKKAHASGTRVVLTITQMNNDTIEQIMDDPSAQENAVNQVISQVKQRGIDGVNVDFEYIGNPGSAYRDAFSSFVRNITKRMHEEIPGSRVTVSVYASSAKVGEKKLYDIATLGREADGIFMMAYDFAVARSDHAIPTAPLYGKKEGKYAYDVSSAVEDFLKQMSPDKLILGVPYYGYNYMTYSPSVKSQTRPTSWRGRPHAQTYTLVKQEISPEMEGISAYRTGWDDFGKVSYRAYREVDTGTWRMIFLDDAKSLGIKYDFAKSKNLAGIGMWALGFDNGYPELWDVLREKFGTKLADSRVQSRVINEGT